MRKYIIKMTEEEKDELVEFVESRIETGTLIKNYPNLYVLIRRIRLIESGTFPEFIEEA